MQRPNLSPLLIFGVLTLIGACLLVVFVASGLMLVIQPEQQSPTETPTPITSARVTIQVASTPHTPVAELPPAFVATSAPTATSAEASTQTAPPTTNPSPAQSYPPDCPPPDGWEPHVVEPGETLFAYVLGALNTGVSITTRDVRQGNCLTSDLLQVGQTLYLPPDAAANAPSSDPIGAPPALVASGPRTPNCDPHCTISIRSGSRVEQIAAAIDNVPVSFWGADFLAAIGPGVTPPGYDFLGSKPAGVTLEGYLYPGTYELSNTTTAAEFRDMLLAAFAANYAGDFASAAQARGLTFYQALTLASIIQRESWAYSEQVLISSVFNNRLQRGEKLGATVTTQYALGGPGNWWPRVTGGQINTASPYNTNLNPGLPPTPINSPGIDAIRAALYPADTGYLFFTGNCQGSGNLYATTFDEHLANVNLCN